MITATGCGTESSAHDNTPPSDSAAVRSASPGNPDWYFASVTKMLSDAEVNGGWAQSPMDVIPGGAFTDLVVVGAVTQVVPGRGYVYSDDESVPDQREYTSFDDPEADARDLVATLTVDQAWGPPTGTEMVGSTVTLRFGGPPSWDAEDYASALLGMGRAVFFLVHRAAPDESEYGVVGPGPLIGLLDGDRLRFPAVTQPNLGIETNFMAPYATLGALRGLLRGVNAVQVRG